MTLIPICWSAVLSGKVFTIVLTQPVFLSSCVFRRRATKSFFVRTTSRDKKVNEQSTHPSLFSSSLMLQLRCFRKRRTYLSGAETFARRTICSRGRDLRAGLPVRELKGWWFESPPPRYFFILFFFLFWLSIIKWSVLKKYPLEVASLLLM